MKVAHFCTFPHGGAAMAAQRQHQGLLRSGIASRFYYFRNDNHVAVDKSYTQIEFQSPPPGPFAAVYKFMAKRRRRRVYALYNRHVDPRGGGETFAMAELPDATKLDWPAIDADVVNLHWLSFFADYPSFFRSIPDHIPIVWTLHDTHAFTGGCHYNSGCFKFADVCGNCPQVAVSGPQDVSLASFLAKRSAYAKKRIHVVAPCDWMLEQASRSAVWPRRHRFEKIEYGLDQQVFFPVDKTVARQRLGIKSTGPLIAFGAVDVANPRKGIQHLLEALPLVRAQLPDVECLVFGGGELDASPNLPRLHRFGFVDSAERLRMILSAADVLALPSIEDNQPQVGLEAMACGTPLVAFQACGMPEYVKAGISGWLARPASEKDFADKIVLAVRSDKALAKSTVKMISQRFEIGAQTARWVKLYQAAIDGRGR